MAKHQDSFYFDTRISESRMPARPRTCWKAPCASTTPESIREKLDEMHAIEHGADEKKHALLNALVKSLHHPD